MSVAMPSASYLPLVIVSANSLWNITNFRSKLIEAFEAAGYQVRIAAPPGTAENGKPHFPMTLQSDGLNPFADARLFLSYLRLFLRERPAAYVSFTAKPNIYGALAAGLLNIPAYPNVSGLGTAFIRGGLLQRLLSILYRHAFRRAPRVFFQNPEDCVLFRQRRLVRDDQAVIVPGSGVDLERFRPQPQAVDGPPVFLFVGRLLGDKGVREFVEAARLLKAAGHQCRFQLLGFAGAANRSAIAEAEIAAWAAEGTVEHLGATADVRPHLARASAVVLPSYREGLPRSLLEAAASARPLIATDVAGNREVIVDGVNGLLCEARSSQSLAAACEKFLRLGPEEQGRMGAASRRMVEERFSEEKVIDAYLHALGGALRSRKGGA